MMLSQLAALAALIGLLLALVGLFRPALLGLHSGMNAGFVGLYGATILFGFSGLGGPPVVTFILLAALSLIHAALLLMGKARVVHRMSKAERTLAKQAPPGLASALVATLLVASLVGAWVSR
ncbi:hypothetical protein ACL00X_14465 [Aeromonas diversa]|nr:hypothetical protein [Aeromonas diversa]